MLEEVREKSIISAKVYLYCSYFVTQLTTLMLVWTARFTCWPILLRPRACCCRWLYWQLP